MIAKPSSRTDPPSGKRGATLVCAIYTRKSSEEGLEQDFNSLDAQRESCAAFIQSQRALGWKASPTLYDDGGFSGGNVQRPGLQQLMRDIQARRIQVVVVYKVDRLTRSLVDFAKLVELFDAHGVSFVSVTQAFNTTNSMGRLTLNVLLSFAQFEREVTGERIRDKIAASKRKGMWMGGIPPMGYVPSERTLSVHVEQALMVREIFSLYLDLGCVRELKAELDKRGWVTPLRQTKRPGAGGNRPFSRGHLYRILSNPIYIGQIAHKGEVFAGNHMAIIEQEVWDAVQEMLASNRNGAKGRINAINPSLLVGLLVDASGERLVPTHTKKRTRRYRYYVSANLHEGIRADAEQGIRVPAHELETAVIDSVTGFLRDEVQLLDWVNGWQGDNEGEDQTDKDAKAHRPLFKEVLRRAQQAADALEQDAKQHLLSTIQSIVLHAERLEVAVKASVLSGRENDENVVWLTTPIELKRRGMAMQLIVNNDVQARGPDLRLLKLIAQGHAWLAQMTSGNCVGVGAMADEAGVDMSYVTRLMYLAFLAPDVIQTIAQGKHPADLTAEKLYRMAPLPSDWGEQRRLLGMEEVSQN